MVKWIIFFVACFFGTVLVNPSFWKQRQKIEREEKLRIIQLSFGVSLIVTGVMFLGIILFGELLWITQFAAEMMACAISHSLMEAILEKNKFKNVEVMDRIRKDERKICLCFAIIAVVIAVIFLIIYICKRF